MVVGWDELEVVMMIHCRSRISCGLDTGAGTDGELIGFENSRVDHR